MEYIIGEKIQYVAEADSAPDGVVVETDIGGLFVKCGGRWFNVEDGSFRSFPDLGTIVDVLRLPRKVGDTVTASEAQKLPNGSVIVDLDDGKYARLIVDGTAYADFDDDLDAVDLAGKYKIIHLGPGR